MAASSKGSRVAPTLIVTAIAALPLLAAPPLIRGLAARDWVEHYASLETFPRPRRATARSLVARAETAMFNLAPLPQASAAAIRALEIGERIERRDRDRESALALYDGIRDACARVRARPLAGSGFSVIEARAAALGASARRPAKP